MSLFNKILHTYFRRNFRVYVFLMVLISASCAEFIEISPPKTQLVSETVFRDNATATAAISAIYNQMINQGGFMSGGVQGMNILGGFSADELIWFPISQNTTAQQFFENSIIPSNSYVSNIWSECYNYIYKANAIIEGLQKSNSLSPDLKLQLEGEAKFIRALCHFYLANLYGNIPYIETTSYQANARVGRIDYDMVLGEIINDLIDAKANLVTVNK